MSDITSMFLAQWAEHRKRKPASYGTDYAVHVDHLRIECDDWKRQDAAFSLLVGSRLAIDAITKIEGGVSSDE